MTPKQPNSTDQHIGTRIRTRRLMLGMSQTDLGNTLGITFQQVQKYEKGTNRVGGSRMAQIAAVLEVPPSYFFDGLTISKDRSKKHDGAVTLSDIEGFIASPVGYDIVAALVGIKSKKLLLSMRDLVGELAEGKY
jgi:transcriptional regulator with XRE-family HTH domain